MKETAPSMNAAIISNPPNLPNSTTNVVPGTAIDTICFYIVRSNKWMLNSGCTDHITHKITDYSTYQSLQEPCTVFLADEKKAVSYISIGTVMMKTWVNGREKSIELQNILHSPDIRGCFILVLRIGEKGISITFEGSKVNFDKNGVQYAEGQLTG